MLSDISLGKLAKIFVGDETIKIEDNTYQYAYKKGEELVNIFNDKFDFYDEYGPGFASRWFYAKQCIRKLQKKRRIR